MNKCPICKTDLSALDLVSKNEHIEDCAEVGPGVLDVNESGQIVRRTNLPLNKQRKICPICDKTFQSIHTHYKTCALKNDLPPQLMLDHWDQFNEGTKTSKKFPRELLDNFISKSIKEGRVGEQVDYARALLLSLYEGEPESKRPKKQQVNSNSAQQQTSTTIELEDDNTNQSTVSTHSNGQRQQITNKEDSNLGEPQQSASRVDVDQVLMASNEASCSNSITTGRSRGKQPKKYPLELVDDQTKEHNIQLRIDREVSTSQRLRYEQSLKNLNNSSGTTRPDETNGESSSTQVDGVA